MATRRPAGAQSFGVNVGLRPSTLGSGDTPTEVDGPEAAGVNEQGIVHDAASGAALLEHRERQADPLGQAILGDVLAQVASHGAKIPRRYFSSNNSFTSAVVTAWFISVIGCSMGQRAHGSP